MNRRSKTEQAITLIALVVTIVVLLILAGVSISMLTGENGIITQAQDAKKGNKEAEIEEQVRLAVMAARSANAGDLKVESLNSELKKIGNNKDITRLPDTIEIKGVKISIDEKGNTQIVGSGNEEKPVVLNAGLYDESDNLVASWDELVNTYGMDVEQDYSSEENYYETSITSPYYVLTNTTELSIGVKLVIADSIKNIGACAFSGCINLTDVTIGANVTSIDASAFWGCENLTNVIISDNVTNIGEWAFSYCTNLTNIIIGDNVISIGEYAFEYCTNLASINISNGVETIGDRAFIGCEKLKNVVIPASVTYISSDTFMQCTNLESITVDENNMNYSSDNGILFDKNKTTLMFCPIGFKGSYVIPNGVTSIDRSAFESCSGLTSIVIPEGVTYIEGRTFWWCENLENVILPNSLEKIKYSAFNRCTSLTSIEIPVNVLSIEEGAFNRCDNLISVIFKSTSDWNVEGETTVTIKGSDLSDPTTAATYLRSTYVEYDWSR